MSMRYFFRDLVDVPALQALTDDLYTATGIPSAIIAMDGEVLTGSGWQRICTEFHRKHPDIERDCVASDTAIRQGIAVGEEYVLYECPRGLVDACSPVVIEEEHVANVFAGQLFMTPPDASKEAFFRETARRYHLDEEAYLAAYREIPVLPEDKFRPALRFLSRFARLVASIGLARLREMEAKGQLAADEKKYRRLLESTSTVPWELDLGSGEFTYLGPQAQEILGFPPSRWKTLDDWAATIHEDDRGRAVRFRLAESAVGRDHEFVYRVVADDGRIVWIHDLASVIDGPSGPEKLVGFLHDITAQKTEEEGKARSQQRLESVIRTAMDGFWIVGLDGRILQVNETYCAMSGYTEAELLSMSIPDVEALESRADTAVRIQELAEKGEVRFESRHRRKDGQILEVEVSAQFQARDEGQIVVFIRDITERKEAEAARKVMEARLRQSQKMEAVGTLAGGIAHDFNNILAAILGYAELTLAALPVGSEQRENLQEVLVASNRARDLVGQILNFSRSGEEQRSPVEPSRVVAEAMSLLRSTLPTTIDFVLDIDAGAGFVLDDASRVHQVVMNLCTNAYHAMRDTGGTLTVRVVRVEVAAEEAARVEGLRPGNFVKLVVADTGTGMAPETTARIFEPYFTTKRQGEGTGLGLSVVQGIVVGSGGAISVESAPGSGTIFAIYLPRIVEVPAPKERSVPQALEGVGSILFVDDEPSIAKLGKRMLESLGYKVREMTSSKEALRVFESDPLGFDLIVTDQTMPGLTGADLARQAMAIRPGMRTVICSGYSDVIDENGARVLGVEAFVMKPYDRTTLATVVRNAIEKDS